MKTAAQREIEKVLQDTGLPWGIEIGRKHRNEGAALSISLIRQAVAATRYFFGEPPDIGMVTFVNTEKVRVKRNPGYCYLRAGFEVCGETKGGLLALRTPPESMPPPKPPLEKWRKPCLDLYLDALGM